MNTVGAASLKAWTISTFSSPVISGRFACHLGPFLGDPLTTVQRAVNARREARQKCCNVKTTGRRGVFCKARCQGGRAESRKNWEKNPANCATAGLARTQAFQHGGLDMFTKMDTQTHPHTDIDTHTSCLFHSFSQDVIYGSGMDASNRRY